MSGGGGGRMNERPVIPGWVHTHGTGPGCLTSSMTRLGASSLSLGSLGPLLIWVDDARAKELG